MRDNHNKHNRRPIRLNEYDNSFPNWYYVTICTQDRRNLFGKIILNEAGWIVDEEWIRTKKIRKHIDLDFYTIMPNHLHGIIIIEQSHDSNIINGRGELNSPSRDNTGRIQYAPTKDKFNSPSHTLGAIVRGFKSSVTKRIRELLSDSGLKVWQRNYYEHIIRNEIDLHNIRQYIANNPLKWEIDDYYRL